MMFLPKKDQFVKMNSCDREHVAHVRLASIAGPDSIGPIRKSDPAVGAKIDDHLNVSVETMHVPRIVVHGVRHKPYAVKPDRTHLSRY
jgi:hypothetical protein